ncbi:hypothetical protein BH24ACT21_BH24ACT21_07960 [soil metagenome]
MIRLSYRSEQPIIPCEAVDAHEANLYDIDAKHGDVFRVDEILEYLGKVSASSSSSAQR